MTKSEEKVQLLDLKSDWVFKKIFGAEGNEDILADLLSAILNIKIKSVELKNTELTKERENQKKSVLDIKAILNDNTIVNIEMQVKAKPNMLDRDIQYLTKVFSEQLNESEDYVLTKKAVVINILGENIIKRNSYHSVAHMKYEKSKEENIIKMYKTEDETMTEKLEVHIIELKKFIQYMKENKVKDERLTWWLELFVGKEEDVKMALSKGAQKIKKAYERLQYLSKDEKAKMEFDEYREAEIREYVDKYYARKEGHEEGRAEGIKEGRKKGLIEGAKQKQIEVAKKMLKAKAPITDIIQFTELTKEEIKNIEKQD